MSAIQPKSNPNPAPIVLVEDSEEDTEAILRALRASGVGEEQVDCFFTGDSVMDYLLRRESYQHLTSSRLPQLILLDLNLPGRSGQSVLQEIKSSESLKLIPVVVLTSSNRGTDVENCYGLGANSYVTKPIAFSDLVNAMNQTRLYWFDIATMPKLFY